ncbi:uncharacterized protein LOC126375740 [Pectinophora gossypiella]|uniref:uncharacterized protein LOC126375740 n=1 Tax=Pectinophora gossypiella TaxID=13191 RepID=UPI00214E0941|nr:uncharacterized protein LOC126375740 [Pectinophora gossypiella]XP_049878798.1 uncharacterized protein LOC126375740 [Pectinophora gossypiella]XP_049878799.1 uncharacterized protein LOC126375740 [Pectinophora gossypiella]XP_049878800.1 uncharacterized protein LOC126375740 [Pectinophora gossypiella]XP_049878801.1 uncharacterized protein LOC126375740 [Pectinophora gossypiella]
MDTVYPAGASALARGRRLRRGPQRARTRTQPVTFAEIKEVDEECEESGGREVPVGEAVARAGAGAGEERRRRDEVVAAGDVGAMYLSHSRRRRARKDVIVEPPDEPPCSRAASEPRAPSDP